MGIKSFAQYMNESTREVTICPVPGMSVPTSNHLSLFETTASVAGKGGVYRIHPLRLDESPLGITESVKYARKMAPRHARSIVLDENITSVRGALTRAYHDGYTRVNIVVPEDHRLETEVLVESKNGVSGKHGFYHFREGVNVISSGSRTPDSQKLVEAASANDFRSFIKHIPSEFAESKTLYNHVRKGMGLSETHDFRSHIQLSPVSEAREAYVTGDLFSVGQQVVTENGDVGTIIKLGSNHVLVEDTEGIKSRHWLDSVHKIAESELSVLDPKLDRFLDRVFHKNKYQKGVKYYIKRHGNSGTRQDLVKVARMTNLDFWNLEKTLHNMINKGYLPKSLATRKDLLESDSINNVDTTIAEQIEDLLIAEEESEVDRVEREKRQAEMDLEREYQDKLEDARRRDEIEDEQERRREDDETDDETDEDEPVTSEQTNQKRSFKEYRSLTTRKGNQS